METNDNLQEESQHKFIHYMRLSMVKDYDDMLEAYDIVMSVGMHLARTVPTKISDDNEITNSAVTLFQMTIMKGLAIYDLAQGLNYDNSSQNGSSIKGLIDPMSLSLLVRNQYESFSLFHNIFNPLHEENVLKLLYDMWVTSGLKERHRFPLKEENDKMSERMKESYKEIKRKIEHDLKQIEIVENRIKSNPIYLNFHPDKKVKFDKWIENKFFPIRFHDGEFKGTHWMELFMNTGAKEELFETIYSLLGTSSHPTYLSVLQYDQMFAKGENIQTAKTLLNLSKNFMCFLISNYCQFIPQAKVVFLELPEINRFLIDSANKQFRLGDYALSNTNELFEAYAKDYFEKKIKPHQ